MYFESIIIEKGICMCFKYEGVFIGVGVVINNSSVFLFLRIID